MLLPSPHPSWDKSTWLTLEVYRDLLSTGRADWRENHTCKHSKYDQVCTPHPSEPNTRPNKPQHTNVKASSEIMQAGRRYTDRRSWEVPLGVMRKIAFGEGSESQKKRKLRENNLLKSKESTSPLCSSFLSSHLQVSLWPKIVVSWGRNLKRPIASSDRASSAPDMPSIFPLWAFHSSLPSITARQRIAAMSDVPSRTFSQLSNSQCLLATCNVSQVPATPLL